MLLLRAAGFLMRPHPRRPSWAILAPLWARKGPGRWVCGKDPDLDRGREGMDAAFGPAIYES